MRYLLLTLLLVPAAGWAEGFNVCGKPYDPANPLSWESLNRRFQAEIKDRRFEDVLRTLLREFSASPRQGDTAVKKRFEDQASAAISGENGCCTDFAVQKLQGDDAFGDDRLLILKGAIDLSACAGRADQNDELRYYAHAFENIGNLKSSPSRIKTARSIRNLDQEFQRFLFEGFPMYPWEAAATGALLANDALAKGPPLNQLVLAHPSLGVGIATERFSKATVKWGLAVEPVGWVRYFRGSEHRSWWGVSTLLFFKEGTGMGAGLAARYDHFTVGVTWHDVDDNNRLFDEKPQLFVGVELFQFAGKKIRRYEALGARVRDIVKDERAPSGQPADQ